MRVLSLLAPLIAGCGPVTAVLVDPALLGDTEDTDTDTDTDTDVDTDTDTVPTLPSVWIGSRTYTFPEVFGTQCIDSIDEEGEDVTSDPDWSGAVAACPACDQVFLVATDPDRICDEIVSWWDGIPVANPVLRGVVYTSETRVDLYKIGEGSNGALAAEFLASGTLRDGVFEYTYTGSITGASYTVDGEVALD